MPRMDALTRLFNAQAITGNGKSDILPLKASLRDIAVGVVLYFYLHVVEAFADSSGTDAVATLRFETDDNEAFSSGTLRQTIGTIAHGAAVGTVIPVIVSPDVLIEAFVRVDVAVASGPFSTGKVTGYFTPDPQLWRAYKTPIGPAV